MIKRPRYLSHHAGLATRRVIPALALAVATLASLAGLAHAPRASAATGDHHSGAGHTSAGANASGDGKAKKQGSQAKFSRANRLLFMNNQLGGIQHPKLLKYKYSVSGTADDYSDRINLAVRPGKKSGKNVHVNFLSGKRHRYVPEITDAHGNPITEIFLQHDAWTLGKNTGGSWRFFQKRIKIALQRSATVKKKTLRYQGQSIHATQVIITPFSAMQKHEKAMGQSLGRRYVFTLSKAVPGGVVKITSTEPGGQKSKPNVRKVEFASSQPLGGAKKQPSQARRAPNAPTTAANKAADTIPTRTILVLPFDLVDTSVNAGTIPKPLASDVTRLHRTSKVARRAIDKLSVFRVMPDSAVQTAIDNAQHTYRYLYECNGCDVQIGKKAGADLVMTGWVQKVSNLILNVNATVRDVASGKVVAEAGVSMRGDTNQSWFDSTRYMIKHPLLTNYRAVMAGEKASKSKG